MTAPEQPLADEEIQAYVDGRLDSARQQEIQRFLSTQPELARRVASYQAQREGLRAAFAGHTTLPIPPELNLMRLLETRLQRRGSWWRIAAAVVLSLGVGASAGWYSHAPSAPSRNALAVSVLQQQALASHTVYAAERRHPVEVTAAERDHLVQWLSNRLRRTVAPPDLTEAGYHLLGGRLLATERGGAAALFVYDDDQGNRLTVLMRPMAPELQATRSDISQGPVNGCTWIDKGLGYAVVAATSDEVLDRVARQISDQAGRSG